MQTGENEQGLRKILDMTRMMSLVIMLVHLYYFNYQSFKEWGITTSLSDRLLLNIVKTGLFKSFDFSKFISIGLLAISLVGARGKKSETASIKLSLLLLIPGTVIFFLSKHIFLLTADPFLLSATYIVLATSGYLLFLSGGTSLSRIIHVKLAGDIFNAENETFPQEERLLENEFSINLPCEYYLKKKRRKSWINIINPFRSLLVMGSPGAGKSYFVIRHVITQHLSKGFSMFVYDFKFDDLSVITYNHFLNTASRYNTEAKFYVINFEDLSRTHRCNPLDRENMLDITDASEAARTILMGLNREWIRKQGDFFVESPINFLTAIIWWLRRYRDGEFCTLPHVIELMQVNYDNLFTLLRSEKEIEALINPFISAYMNDVMEQLEGQIASAKISMARLSSPQLYYVLSGNDFTLDINNPAEPKVVCMGNNPQKIQVYGAVLSLYISRLIKTVNKKGKLKCSLIFDEFPTIYLNNMDSLIATARSNKVATTLGVQDFSQLKKDYGKDQADVIMNIVGNVVSGQVTGETAKQLSERFGKIMQDRTSLSINRSDTSVSKSRQLDSAIPASKIASLSSGEFVGMVADDPENKISLKSFHCSILNDHAQLKREQETYKPVPKIADINNRIVQLAYEQIKQDISDIVESELERMLNDPALQNNILRKSQ